MTMEREKRAAYLREWRAKNKEKNKEYDRKQRQKNADKIKESRRLAYLKNKETETEQDRLKRKEYKKSYYLENKARLSEKSKVNHHLNKDRDNERVRQWCAENREYKKQQDKIYYEENKEAILNRLKEETQKRHEASLAGVLNTRSNLVRSALWAGYAYDPKSGELIREYCSGGTGKIGTVGNLNGHGYLLFGHEHKSYRVSVVAYEIMTNTKLPKGKVIDHVNGLKTDNAWSNLRLTTPRGNNQNKKIHRQGRLVGYTFDKKRQLYVAQISINQRAKRLGCFTSEIEAHQVYIKACEEIGE